MLILSPSLPMPGQPYGNLHTPPARRSYKTYRNCLRWDFGFTCAACLLHESVFGPHGYGQTSAEHVIPQTTDDTLINSYGNLIYLCVRCNSARQNRSLINTRGNRILDPRVDPWGSRFDLIADKFVGRDSDADYTIDAYDLNDEVKVNLRKRFREELTRTISAYLRLWEVSYEPYSVEDAAFLRQLRNDFGSTLRSKYSLQPSDAPSRCTCGRGIVLQLPSALASIHQPAVSYPRILS